VRKAEGIYGFKDEWQMTVMECTGKFIELSRFTANFVPTESI